MSLLEEDYTFGIAVDQVLATQKPGATVVTNWSTSHMLQDIASAHHANLRRAPTGEVYTATEAAHYSAAIAGEGSCAGVIDPRVGMGRDVLRSDLAYSGRAGLQDKAPHGGGGGIAPVL